MTNEKANVFISYSREDEIYLKELKKYIGINNCPDIILWDDTNIQLGASWTKKIKENLENADIILLLISQDFLNSNYILHTELKIALEKNERENCPIIPIFTKFCDLDSYPEITQFQGSWKMWLSEAEKERPRIYTSIKTHINEIASAIIKKKKETKAHKQEISTLKIQADHLRNKKKIFLSIPESKEGKIHRTTLIGNAIGRIEWEGWEYQIVPDTSEVKKLLRNDNVLDANAITRYISESIYSIHIVTSERDLIEGIDKLQYNLAKEAHKTGTLFKQIFWLIKPAIKSNLNEELRKEIQESPNIIGLDLENIFETIKSIDVQKNKLISDINGKGSENIEVYMFYDFVDHSKPNRIKLKEKIEQIPNVVMLANDHSKNLTKEKEELMRCHGATIYYGDADVQWFMFRQSLLVDANNIKAKLVYIDEPGVEIKVKRDLNKNRFLTIEGNNNFEPENEKFIKALKA